MIGDLILDAYHHGHYMGQSVDNAATPVALERLVNYTWGGAGLVVRNILALGTPVTFISMVGKDSAATHAHSFTHEGLSKKFLVIPHRRTTVKERFWIDDKKLLEWQHFDNRLLAPDLQKKLFTLIEREIARASKVMIADYRHGLLSPALSRKIIRLCAVNKVPLYIDSQVAYNEGNHAWYRGAYLVCLNEDEARSVYAEFDPEDLGSSLAEIQRLLKTKHVVVKLGGLGSVALFEQTFLKVPAHPVTPLDASGAGDAFLAAVAIGSALPTHDDLARANIWAAHSVTMIGTEIPPIARYHTSLKQAGLSVDKNKKTT